jgi:predicted  nucleic acid-binding Zn-ribbon protein
MTLQELEKRNKFLERLIEQNGWLLKQEIKDLERQIKQLKEQNKQLEQSLLKSQAPVHVHYTTGNSERLSGLDRKFGIDEYPLE